MRRLVWLLCGLFSAAVAAAPDVVLKDLNGRERNVNEFVGRGKWVALTVWAHDCHVCAAEIHELAEFHRAHRSYIEATPRRPRRRMRRSTPPLLTHDN